MNAWVGETTHLPLFLSLSSIKKIKEAWLVRLSALGIGLRSKGSLVRFPVRAQAWAAG